MPQSTDIAALKQKARVALEDAIEYLRKERELPMYLVEVMRDDSVRMIFCDAGITNSTIAKRDLGNRIRADVAAGECVATLLVSDTYIEETTPEKAKVRHGLGLTIEQGIAAGLCQKREAVVVVLESPIYLQQMTQEYRREGDAIALVGDPVIWSSLEHDMRLDRGTVSGFFAPAQTAGAARQ